jgi:hypothetical protein
VLFGGLVRLAGRVVPVAAYRVPQDVPHGVEAFLEQHVHEAGEGVSPQSLLEPSRVGAYGGLHYSL